MKLKKILSSVVATAMAVTTFSAFSTTANAADYTMDVFDGEHVLDWTSSLSVTNGDAWYYTGDVEIAMTYTVTDGSDYQQASVKTPDWSANLADASDVSSGGTYTFEVSAVDYANAISANGFIIAGYGITITDIKITGEYDKPSVNVWNKNTDGSYTLTTDDNAATDNANNTASAIPTLAINPADYGVSDVTKVVKVTADVSFEGGAAGGSLGGSTTEETAWQQVTYDGSTSTIEFDYNLKEGSMQLQTYWANVNTTITISNIQFLEVNKVYTQKSAVENGVYSVRGVKLITEEEAKEADAVRFYFYNGKTAAIDSTKCYHTIKAGGNTLTAPEGYVFVALAVGNIPEGKTVTCSNIQLAYND